MSFSVDDLVASLSSSVHIGQEAVNLADLQTQLSQMLLFQQQQQQQQQQAVACPGSAHAPCNTPTARTPSTSLANWSPLEQRRNRSSSSASTNSRRAMPLSEHENGMAIAEEDMEMDDESAVEQLVGTDLGYITSNYSGSSSPVRYRERNSSFSSPTSQYTHGRYTYTNSGSDVFSTSPTVSTFAMQDPFYAAAEASSRQAHQSSQNSFFAQVGRPAQHSPFFAAHATQSSAATHAQGGFDTFSHPMVAAGTVDA